jgi:hypothetical protein
MIYLIGGKDGLRKSTIIVPCFKNSKPIYSHSTDLIRASTSYLFASMGQDPRQVTTPSGKIEGEDYLAWIGTMGLIKLLNPQDFLIEGVAIQPEWVKSLELQDPKLNIRAAFVGYSQNMEFEPPKWTPELEKLVETTFGKNCLEDWKKREWRYPNMHIYDGVSDSERIRNAVSNSGGANFKYFDLVDSIPHDRRTGNAAKLRLEDHIDMAIKIRFFLVGQ